MLDTSSLFQAGHVKKYFILLMVLVASGSLHAAESEQFIEKITMPSGQTVVIAEGDFEARSIGSFSVRLYDAASPEDETTFFSAGQIHARDGTIEKVLLADIAGDKQPEIVVTVRSVGTGGYISAHAFSINKQLLSFEGTVENLPSDTDPIVALRELIENQK